MTEASVIRKIIIKGELVLDSPLLIGSGAEGVETDIRVLKDRDGVPYIPGTSLAGALRASMGEMTGDGLFGCSASETPWQSMVQIADVMLADATLTVRDGVSLDTYTKTTIKGHKYTYEAIERGARGALYIEVTLRQSIAEIIEKVENMVLIRIAMRLAAGLHIGALTAKGFGRVRLECGRLSIYDFTDFAAVQSYLMGREAPGTLDIVAAPEMAAALSGADLTVRADFALESALLVRDYVAQSEGDTTIAARQKKSGDDYLIPGTSIKGALRHRAEELADMLGKPRAFIDGLMGQPASAATKQKSRLTVEECYIRAGLKEAQQSRNRIDRFTGGTVDSALFTEVPVWQERDGEATVRLELSVREASAAETGLMLYLLRELWQGRLPLGGEAGIGRGVLRGLGAEIAYQGELYELDAAGRVTQGERSELEALAQAFYDMELEEARA